MASRSQTPPPVHARRDAQEQSGSPARPASERVRLRRKRERGSFDRAVIDAILDEALIAHLGISPRCTLAVATSSTCTGRWPGARCARSRPVPRCA
jgi:hypothetical protein